VEKRAHQVVASVRAVLLNRIPNADKAV
jgi:hypothetical protein